MRDFVIADEAARGLPGLYDLIGIESPGLTAALAIAEYVAEMIEELRPITRRRGVVTIEEDRPQVPRRFEPLTERSSPQVPGARRDATSPSHVQRSGEADR